MKTVFTIGIIIFMMLIASIAWSDIIHVPDDQLTIQAGIDAAQYGDVVLVADGVYKGSGNKNLDFKSKIIEVRSENGPEHTIIDLEGDILVNGFSFHSGEGTLSVVDGFTITNGGQSYEAGINCNKSSPTITHCMIIGNSFCAIKCTDSSPIIANTIIVDNDSGVAMWTGIACDGYSSPEIKNNIIMNNNGYGISCMTNSSPIISQNIIAGNKNWGIYCEGASPKIINNTICFNIESYGYGGGIYSGSYSAPTVLNTILWGNKAQEIKIDLATIYVTYSDVKGGWPGEGNIDADPMFVSATDYHLQAGSPCIDAGDPNSPRDPDGTRADMGAFYYSPSGDKVKKPPTTTDFSDAVPSQSMLLPNYPNPFKLNPFNPTPWIPYHPKTWIPYLLATDANVIIRIYNTKGQLIHTIDLGNKKAGTYMLKDKAAIWDGRDDTGVRVGSGIYFYTLQAGDFIATRRMVIY